jgi:hypothetical protein
VELLQAPDRFREEEERNERRHLKLRKVG